MIVIHFFIHLCSIDRCFRGFWYAFSTESLHLSMALIILSSLSFELTTKFGSGYASNAVSQVGHTGSDTTSSLFSSSLFSFLVTGLSELVSLIICSWGWLVDIEKLVKATWKICVMLQFLAPIAVLIYPALTALNFRICPLYFLLFSLLFNQTGLTRKCIIYNRCHSSFHARKTCFFTQTFTTVYSTQRLFFP